MSSDLPRKLPLSKRPAHAVGTAARRGGPHTCRDAPESTSEQATVVWKHLWHMALYVCFLKSSPSPTLQERNSVEVSLKWLFSRRTGWWCC